MLATGAFAMNIHGWACFKLFFKVGTVLDEVEMSHLGTLSGRCRAIFQGLHYYKNRKIMQANGSAPHKFYFYVYSSFLTCFSFSGFNLLITV